jgi:hypothetical protein
MSTNDVPGFNPANNDELCAMCWAEHDDGSLILVESTEGSRVIYSIFDMSKDPPIEYRDAMPEASFKRTFSWKSDDVNDIAHRSKSAMSHNIKWTWHDKTPFPWDRVIRSGAQDGGRHAFAEHTLNAAERVAESLRLRGNKIRDDLRYRKEETVRRSATIWDKISRAVNELRR